MRLDGIAIIAAAFLAIAGIAPAANANGDCPPVNLTIVMDKSEYLLDEPLWVDVLIVNSTDTTATLPPPQSSVGLFSFILMDQKGNTVPENPPIVVSGASRSPDEAIAPGDTLYSLRNLMATFGNHLPWLSAVNSLPAGLYTVQAEYDGKYTSNRLTFTVAEPQGVEADAHELLMTGLDLNWKKRYDESTQRLQALIEEHPKSVYAVSAYSTLRLDVTELLVIAESLLLNHTTSGGLSGALHTLEEQLGESARPLVDSLKTAANSVRFRKLAERYGY